MKKLHMYAGLLTFTALIVWGVAGVHAVFLPPPGGYRPPDVAAVEEIPLEVPGDLDDKKLAKFIYDAIALPLAGGHYNVRRDERNNLAFYVFTVNGRRDVAYIEERGAARIERRQNDWAAFLSNMHTGHSRRGPRATAARMWGVYNEFATWAFFFMTISGLYLWIATRPGLPWARLTIGASAGVAVVLWLATR